MEQHIQRAIDALERRAAECHAAAKTLRELFVVASSPVTMATPRDTKPPARDEKAGATKPAAKPPCPAKRIGREDVLAAIVGTTGLTATEIADKLGVNSAWYHLSRLVTEGVLVCGGDKKYRRVVAKS